MGCCMLRCVNSWNSGLACRLAHARCCSLSKCRNCSALPGLLLLLLGVSTTCWSAVDLDFFIEGQKTAAAKGAAAVVLLLLLLLLLQKFKDLTMIAQQIDEAQNSPAHANTTHLLEAFEILNVTYLAMHRVGAPSWAPYVPLSSCSATASSQPTLHPHQPSTDLLPTAALLSTNRAPSCTSCHSGTSLQSSTPQLPPRGQQDISLGSSAAVKESWPHMGDTATAMDVDKHPKMQP